MICVSPAAADQAMAWRVRDAMARHPLLGGAVTQIQIAACREVVTLEGWVLDEGLRTLAVQTACRAAGSRPVVERLQVRQMARWALQADSGSSHSAASRGRMS